MPDTMIQFSVSEITNIIQDLLEKSLPAVVVVGEISNFVRHSSGHIYFSLKDDRATLRCTLFRGINRHLRFLPKNGLKVVARGEITVYPPNGGYQLNIKELFPTGVGELHQAFERLKEKLSTEGLFDPEIKQPLPVLPQTIGIVTSPTGAAIRDVINVARRRAPAVQLILRPVRVQGEIAAKEIAQAIDELNQFTEKIDVLIVGRGGGSLEDLWAFNEEVVARAIYRSRIPIVSAVGHEIDFTISDFVADLRAPTPSAAAEIIIPNHADILAYLKEIQSRMNNAIQTKLQFFHQKLHQFQKSPTLCRPDKYIQMKTQRLDDLTQSLNRATTHQIEQKEAQFRYFVSVLNLLNPLAILERGYSVVRKDRKIIINSEDLKIGDIVTIQFARGSAESQINQISMEK